MFYVSTSDHYSSQQKRELGMIFFTFEFCNPSKTNIEYLAAIISVPNLDSTIRKEQRVLNLEIDLDSNVQSRFQERR